MSELGNVVAKNWHRTNEVCHNFRAASLAATSFESLGDVGRYRFPIWPEWDEAQVNKEKWDSSTGPEDGKPSKSPNAVIMEKKIFTYLKESIDLLSPTSTL